MPWRANRILAFGLLLLAVTLAYLPILSATLVADDYRMLSPGFLERPLSYFGKELFPELSGQLYWRPVPVLTFALDRALMGSGSVVPHLTNLLVHLATTAALGMLILSAGPPGTRASGSMAGAMAGMLFFGLHPQNVGAVGWVAARFDLLAGLFGTLGLVLCVRRALTVEASRRRDLAILLLFAAALLCKESAMAFPAAVFLWTLVETLGRRGRERRRENVLFLASVAALVAAYEVLRLLLFGRLGAGAEGLPFRLFWETGLGFLLALVWPFAGTGAVPRPWLYYAVTALVALALVGWLVPRRREPAQARAAVPPWGLPILLLTVSLMGVMVGGIPVRMVLHGAESRLSYVHVIAAATLVGWLMQRVWASRWRLPSAALFLVVCVAFAWTQQYRLSEWERAGQRVDELLARTVQLVPNPAPNSTLVFQGIPLTTDSYCYIFGIGLPEALARRYGRSDLRVIRWGKTLKEIPKDAYVFTYSAQEAVLRLDHRPE